MSHRNAFLMIMMLFLLSLPVYGSDNSSQKAVIVKVNIKNDTFTVLERKVVYGYPPEHFVQWNDFKVRLLSDAGVIGEYGVRDPRIRIYENMPGENPEGYKAEVVDEANLTLIFAFNSSLSEVSVGNYTSGAELVKVNVKDTITSFCSENKNDSDCAGITEKPSTSVAPSSDLTPLTGFAVIAILLIVGFLLSTRRK